MMERTENQKVLQAPVKVILGGTEYEVKPLPLKDSLPWCKAVVAATVKGIASRSSISSDDPEKFDNAMTDLLYNKPEQLIDLFFRYAKDLDRAEIEGKATLNEIMDAFNTVRGIESRFFGWAIQEAATMLKGQ